LKVELTRGQDAAVCAGIGVGGALVFLFAFPKGSITTFMHEVLKLPGPGPGIALVLGPFLVVVALVSALLHRRVGASLVAALAFAASHTVAVKLLGISADSKGAFGSALFVAAIAVFGVAAEAVMVLSRRARTLWRCLLAGALANASLLLFYWVLIFPRTARWVWWGDVPLLMGLCLAAGLVSGGFACVLFKSLSRTVALSQQGADYVRSPRL